MYGFTRNVEPSSSLQSEAAPTSWPMMRSSPSVLSRTLGDSTVCSILVVNPKSAQHTPTVAVTRAQALLIVVGDPSILSVDPIWRGFMNYVYLHGGWRGDAPTWDVNAPIRTDGDYSDELQEALAADMSAFMARLTVGEDGGEDLEGDANVDRPFQETD